jgi:hypothetical protein
MAVTALRTRRSHRRGCRHCVSVDAYRAARIAAELAREEATGGWATELSEYGPIITFEQWLIMGAGSGDAYAYDDYEEAA